MANRSYNPQAVPIFAGPGSSKTIRDEFANIGQGFAEIEHEIDGLSPSLSIPGYATVSYAVTGDTVTLVPGEGKLVIKTDDGIGVVTVVPPAGFTFADGSLSYEITDQFESIIFLNNGVNFYRQVGAYAVPILDNPANINLHITINQDVLLSTGIQQCVVIRTDDGSTGGTCSVQAPDFPTYSIDGEEYLYFTIGGETIQLFQVDNGDSTYTWHTA